MLRVFSTEDLFDAVETLARARPLAGDRLTIMTNGGGPGVRATDALIAREGVTILNQTPSAFRQLIQADLAEAPAPYALREVIFGGEALELQSLKPWIERYGDAKPRLINMYGITETTVHVTYRPITRADVDAGRGSMIGTISLMRPGRAVIT